MQTSEPRFSVPRSIPQVLILLITATWVCPGLALTIKGTVKGWDGNPPVLGHAHITTLSGYYDQTLNSFRLAKDGSFLIQVPSTGWYRLSVTAVNHEELSLPIVIVQPPDVLNLEIQLSATPFKNEFGDVKIYGSWCDMRPGDAESMKRQSDGTFTFDLKTEDDRVSYQLMGITENNRIVNGTQSDSYEFDGGGDYISVINTKPGTVRISFDPSLLRNSTETKKSETVISPELPALTAIWKIDHDIQNQIAVFYQTLQQTMESGKTPDQSQFNWDSITEELHKTVLQQNDPIIRDFAKINLLRIKSLSRMLDDAAITSAREDFPPETPLWGIDPALLTAVYWSQDLNQSFENFKQVSVKNPDRLVKATALCNMIMIADRQSRKDDIGTIYSELKSGYADLDDVSLIIKQYDPLKKVVPGQKLPEFSFHLMDSADSFSVKGLAAKYLLIDFWATWCQPCVQEMPFMDAAFKKYKDRNLAILSISFDKSQEDVKVFRESKWPMPWFHVFAGKELQAELYEKFEIIGIPKLILVGPDGTILKMDAALRGNELDMTLSKYLID